jgi:sugar/nucleoside kinase (ribokinase family)
MLDKVLRIWLRRLLYVDMISFGTVFLELVFGQLDRLPGPGEEVFTDEFAISCGGAVTSATAAAAGGAKAGVCTRLGDDVGSQVAIEHCAEVGIDLAASIQVAGPTAGITTVLNFAGDRGFVTHLPPGRWGGQAERDRWLEVLRRDRPAWCYLHAGHGIPAFLREARRLGCKVMLDISLGDEREGEVMIDCIKLADIFVPNSDELFRLTGAVAIEPAVAAASAWGTQLVVTRGAAGALVTHGDGTFTEVTRGVGDVRVKDLTGAGDNFAGALIAALLAGAPLTGAVVSANAAGSKAVGQLGAVGQVGAGSGTGWPLRPMELRPLTGAIATPGQSGLVAGPTEL